MINALNKDIGNLLVYGWSWLLSLSLSLSHTLMSASLEVALDVGKEKGNEV